MKTLLLTLTALLPLTSMHADESKPKLTELQQHVTMQCGTEPPFKNEYWNNKREGIYVCIISGKPLFSSLDKFDSGTGWPSFTRPLAKEDIKEVTDKSHGMERTEATPTSAMSSQTAPPRPASAIASTRHPSASSQSRIWKSRATATCFRSSKNPSNFRKDGLDDWPCEQPLGNLVVLHKLPRRVP
jgi:methionine-R-sulfoxide reductase